MLNLQDKKISKKELEEDYRPDEEEDENFVVDEYGNPVKYENDENEEDIEKVQIGNQQMMKLIGNMQQDAKIAQSTKVDKNIVKNAQGNINNLMNELDDDDDNDDNNEKNKQKSNFNKQFFNINEDNGNYHPEYNKNKEDIANDIDIDNDNDNDYDNYKDNKMEPISPSVKPKAIRREIKKKEDVPNNSNNTSFTTRRGIKRTIKQQEDFSNISYNATYNKTNYQQREELTLENSEAKDNNYTYIPHNKTKYKLPIEDDNSIKIYWYDAIEESFNSKPNVIFFGKIYEPQSKSYLSISIIIKDIYRTVFVLPKPEYEEKIQEVYEEFDDLRKKRFNFIKEYQCKNVKKKYCFELPIDSEKEHTVLKVKYKAEYGTIPPNLGQKTFDYIFGKKSSLLENILIKLKIKGPCWLRIKNFTENNLNFLRTWSDYELSLDDFKNIEVISNKSDMTVPPMKILSISTQSIRNKNGNELYCICCALKDGYHVEDVKGSNKVDDFQPLIFARKIDNKMSIYKNTNDKNDIKINLDKIQDLNNNTKLKQLLNIGYLYLVND